MNNVKLTLTALVAVLAALFGFAAPAQAAVQTYHSTPVNGMWHSGNVQFYNANTKLGITINWNDVTGDAYCTKLRFKVYQSNGAWGQFDLGTVCGGRSAALSETITAAAGTRLTKIEIWSVRADGGIRSYVWQFVP